MAPARPGRRRRKPMKTTAEDLALAGARLTGLAGGSTWEPGDVREETPIGLFDERLAARRIRQLHREVEWRQQLDGVLTAARMLRDAFESVRACRVGGGVEVGLDFLDAHYVPTRQEEDRLRQLKESLNAALLMLSQG